MNGPKHISFGPSSRRALDHAPAPAGALRLGLVATRRLFAAVIGAGRQLRRLWAKRYFQYGELPVLERKGRALAILGVIVINQLAAYGLDLFLLSRGLQLSPTVGRPEPVRVAYISL